MTTCIDVNTTQSHSIEHTAVVASWPHIHKVYQVAAFALDPTNQIFQCDIEELELVETPPDHAYADVSAVFTELPGSVIRELEADNLIDWKRTGELNGFDAESNHIIEIADGELVSELISNRPSVVLLPK